MLQVKNLSKSYGKQKDVLFHMSFTVKPGTICGIIGDSGAGKSVLLKTIAGLSKKNEGAVFVNHKALRKNLWMKPKEVVYVGEKIQIFPYVSGKRYLEYFARKNQVSHVFLEESKRMFLECFGEKSLDRRISSYSNEMKKILFLLGSISSEPKIYALDDPFSVLSIENRKRIEKKLINERKKGSIIIIASKRMDQIERLYNKIIILKYGMILMEQDIDTVDRYEKIQQEYESVI